MVENPVLFDSARIARYRARANARCAEHEFLRARVLDDVLSRLDVVTRQFDDSVFVSPFALPTKAVLPAHMGQHKTLPGMRQQSLDLLVSHMHLHVENNLPGFLQAARQVLRPNGLFLAAFFGERTLHELRHCLLHAESEIGKGVQARIAPFAEVRALGGLLQGAGFALPVVDIDRVIVRYSTLKALLHDLRGMGESNPLSGPVRPLRRDVLRRAEQMYKKRHSDAQGRLQASFEIVHLSGWAPHESQQKPLKPGSAEVSLTEILGAKPAKK